MAEQDERGATSFARQEGHKEGHKFGVAEGLLAAKRDASIRLLANKGINLAGEDRTRIVACTDITLLDRWFERALSATTAPEVFRLPASES